MNEQDPAAPGLADLLDLDAVLTVLVGLSDVTGLAAALWDADGRRMGGVAGENEFCRLLMSSETGRPACDASHVEAMDLARIAEAPCRHVCHAGLIRLASSIEVEGRCLGYLVVGDRPPGDLPAGATAALAQTHRLDAGALSSAWASLTTWP